MTQQNSHVKGNLRLWSRVAFVASAVLLSCSRSDTKTDTEPWLARVDNTYLYVNDVRKAVPSGIPLEDSLRFVKAYVNNWVESRLISDVATDEVDMEHVDRMVDEYRRNLIVSLYRRAMFESHAGEIPEDSIKAFYDRTIDSWRLERPMVRGTYLKVPDDASNMRILRRLFKSDKQADIDRLEKEVLSSAIHYDYFRNRWIDWEQIETKIPYDFGNDASAWLRSNRTLDFSSGGYTYMLYVSDVLPAGSTAPLEGVRQQIVDMMLRNDRQAYDARLDYQLRERAIERGRLEIKPLPGENTSVPQSN